MAKRQLPDHIKGTVREFRQRKRREWKAVVDALDRFRTGCAYTPVNIYGVAKLVSEARDVLRGNWHPLKSDRDKR